MKKTKLLVSLFLPIAFFGCISFASAEDGPVEMTAPKVNSVKNISEKDLAPSGSKVSSQKDKTATSVDKKKKNRIAKIHKKKHLVAKKIVVNYDKVSKLIEYGYYDDADRILTNAIDRNSKDIKAQALWAISLAKQSKLEPAQNTLDLLLAKYPNNSNLHYAQGIVYYQRTSSSNMLYRNNTQKLLTSAQKEFQTAITLDKNNARAYNAMGVLLIRLNKPKDAIGYFKKSLDADKTYSIAIDNLGTMDYLNGKLADAQKKFKQALVYNTQNTTAMYHLAQIAYRKKDYATALNYLNDALAINTNSPAIYNLLGKVYESQGNEAAAINSFKDSLSVKPEFTLSYYDLAEIYEKRGDNEFAIEQLKTAVSIDKTYYDAKLKIADLSLSTGNYKQAANVYAQLVGIDGYNDIALKGLANAYFGQAQIATNKSQIGSTRDLYNALDYINKAINANSQDLELHLAKLKLAKITNQPDQAQISLNKIIQAPDGNLMNMIVKGEAFLTLNDYKNAQISFNKATKLSNNYDDDLYLSEIFIYHKQYDIAQKMLQKILKTDPQNQEALSSLDFIQKNRKYADNCFKSAQIYVQSKKPSMAIEYLSRTITADPNNSQAHFLLAKLYEKQKDYPSAVSNYKAYLSLTPNPTNIKSTQNKIKRLETRL